MGCRLLTPGWLTLLLGLGFACLSVGVSSAQEIPAGTEKKEPQKKEDAKGLLPTRPSGRPTNGHMANTIREVVNRGVDLYNSGDHVGCYRVFEGCLRTLLPLVEHRPELKKNISDALTNAERDPVVWRGTFILRSALDLVYADFNQKPGVVTRSGSPGGPPAESEETLVRTTLVAGFMALAKGRQEEALATATRILAQEGSWATTPEDIILAGFYRSAAFFLRGMIQVAKGAITDAQADFDRANQIYNKLDTKEFRRVRSSRGNNLAAMIDEILAMSMSGKGHCHLRSDEDDEALPCFEAVTRECNAPEVKEWKIQAYREIAAIYQRKGEDEVAQRSLDKATQLEMAKD